jgi:hypothetical protein
LNHKDAFKRCYSVHLPGQVTPTGVDDLWYNGVGILIYERIKPAA